MICLITVSILPFSHHFTQCLPSAPITHCHSESKSKCLVFKFCIWKDCISHQHSVKSSTMFKNLWISEIPTEQMSRKKAEIILFVVFFIISALQPVCKIKKYLWNLNETTLEKVGKKWPLSIEKTKQNKTEKLPFKHNYFQIFSLVQYLNR